MVYEDAVLAQKNVTFSSYNSGTFSKQWLKTEHKVRAKIPHRANRAVLFTSMYVHATDKYKFKPGYKNRRINYTLLFGPDTATRCEAFLPSQVESMEKQQLISKWMGPRADADRRRSGLS